VRLTQSEKEREPNVEEVAVAVVVVAKGGILSTRGVPMSQGHLRHTDGARQTEALHLDVKLTRTFQQAEVVEGQSRGIGLPKDHPQGLPLVHLPLLLPLNATIAAAAVLQVLYRLVERLDPEDIPAVLHHHLERCQESVGIDLILVVIDHDPMHILNTPAHVRPEDAEGIPRRHHQAFRRRLYQDVERGDEGLHRVNDRGRFQGTSTTGEGGEAEELDDHPHLTHRMIEELQGLMLSRTVLSETTVV
jgi:hypothetical protein